MKKYLITATVALSALLAVSQVSANAGKHSYIDTAKVLDVEPIYETVTVSIPEESCWNKPHRRNRHKNSNHQNNKNSSYTGTIAGGIIGGVVGNQFGHGRGKDAMTVAGTLLGLSIGHDLSQNASYRSSGDTFGYPSKHSNRGHKQHCRTTTRHESRQEIVGYRVKYRYKGNKLWTRTQNHPGKRIKVRVSIKPLHDAF